MHRNECSKCGKVLDRAKQWPVSIALGGAVCLDCLPPDAREAWERLGHSTERLRELAKTKVERFREAAIYCPMHDLVVFWKKVGIVHTSLTTLTHEHSGQAFSVVWAEEFSQGVERHDNFARDFNEGIKYPNIRMSGLADFEHLRAVAKPVQEPDKAKGFLESSRDKPLSHREGNGVFARSIAEALIVAMHAAQVWGLKREEVDSVTPGTMAALVRENEGNATAFEEAWRLENLGAIYEDVQAAVASDVLDLRRFVRCGEIFLLCLERWV